MMILIVTMTDPAYSGVSNSPYIMGATFTAAGSLNGRSCGKEFIKLDNKATAVDREKADQVITTAKGTKIFISYPTDVSDVVKQEKINHIYDILTKHKSE